MRVMQSSSWIFAIALAVVSLSTSLGFAEDTATGRNTDAQETKIAGTSHGKYVIGDAITEGNLKVFPVSSKEPWNADRFITLDEGLKAGTVEVFELGSEAADDREEELAENAAEDVPAVNNAADDDPFGDSNDEIEDLFGEEIEEEVDQVADSAEVNRLMIRNTSNKPLYLLPGEVISGGNQDRTIAEEVVIKPSEKAISIDVYCVEGGRWEQRDAEETIELVRALVETDDGEESEGDASADDEKIKKLVKREQRGHFVAIAGQLNRKGRLAVQAKKGQGEVWREVDKLNAKSGNQNDSANFAKNYADGEIQKKLEKYLKACEEPIAKRPQVVGVVVAVNGKIQAADVFESTPLFLKFWPKLVKGYSLDALTASQESPEKKTPCDVKEVIAYLDEMTAAAVASEEVDRGLKLTRRESKRLVVFSAVEELEEVGGHGGGGGFGGGAGGGFGGGFGGGGAVHTGGLSK